MNLNVNTNEKKQNTHLKLHCFENQIGTYVKCLRNDEQKTDR